MHAFRLGKQDEISGVTVRSLFLAVRARDQMSVGNKIDETVTGHDDSSPRRGGELIGQDRSPAGTLRSGQLCVSTAMNC